MQALLPAGKEYICLMHIHQEIDENKLKETINKFIGTITQLPPVRSAVKRQERERKVYYIDILEIKEIPHPLHQISEDHKSRKLWHILLRKY